MSGAHVECGHGMTSCLRWRRGGGQGAWADGPKERQLAIAEIVIRHGTIGVEKLAALTGVSVMTIYRDLVQLEDRGVVQRHRGKVVAVASAMQEADAEFRLEQQAALKREVAAAAAQMIPSGGPLMLDDSASGITGLGCFHPYQDNVAVKRAMLDSAERRVILLDHSKFSRRALFQFATLDEFDAVVVDSGIADTTLEDLRVAGVAVEVAPHLDTQQG